MTSSSWSDDDSDSNDAAMTSYRDVTTSNGRGPQVQSTSSADQLPLSPVSTSSPTDLVETFDVYYVLPPPGKKRTAHRGPLPVPTTRWTGRQQLDHRGELTLTERRRPNTNCLLDAVPPTPSCCNDLRAATLPASVVNGWTSPPPRGLVSVRINNTASLQQTQRKGKKMITKAEKVCRYDMRNFSFLFLRLLTLLDRSSVCVSICHGVHCSN